MTLVLRQFDEIRRQDVGRLSDRSDLHTVTTTMTCVDYMGDDGLQHRAEFDHAPTPAEIDALAPRNTAARNAIRVAVNAWQTAQTDWTAATTVAQQLVALHEEHVAIIAAIRALGLATALS